MRRKNAMQMVYDTQFLLYAFIYYTPHILFLPFHFFSRAGLISTTAIGLHEQRTKKEISGVRTTTQCNFVM